MTHSDDKASLSVDSMLDALGSRPRRRLLVNLMEKNPRDEANQLDELEPEADEDQFLTRLHHQELPKLDDAGFIDWERKTGKIVKGPKFDEIRPLIALMNNHKNELPDDWL